MKRSFKFIGFYALGLCLFYTTLMFTGCKTDFNQMIDNYNGHFAPTEDEVVPPCPGDSNFDQSQMLFPTYQVCTDGTINLAGPYKCKSYKWEFLDKEKNTLLQDTTRTFVHYLPLTFQNELSEGSYLIKLTVIGEDEQAYSDEALVIVYNRITKE